MTEQTENIEIEEITVGYLVNLNEENLNDLEKFKSINTKPEGLESTLTKLDGVLLRKQFKRSFKLTQGIFKLDSDIYRKNYHYYIYKKIGDL
jgi:hypothetical protein